MYFPVNFIDIEDPPEKAELISEDLDFQHTEMNFMEDAFQTNNDPFVLGNLDVKQQRFDPEIRDLKTENFMSELQNEPQSLDNTIFKQTPQK